MSIDWRPIASAPKPAPHAEPPEVAPRILLRFGSDGVSVGYWDWYYAEGGHGYDAGHFAWVEPCSGERLSFHFTDAPTHWADISNCSPEDPSE